MITKDELDAIDKKARAFVAEYEALCLKHSLRLGWEDDRVDGEPAEIVMPYKNALGTEDYYTYDRGYLISIGKD